MDLLWISNMAKTLPFINKAVTHVEHLQAGAMVEELMIRKGWSLKHLDCDPTNRQLLGLIAQIQVNIEIDGRVTVKEDVYKKIENCGNCKRSLKMYMKAGDRCPYCDGEYKGC